MHNIFVFVFVRLHLILDICDYRCLFLCLFQGFLDFEDDFLVEWEKKLHIGTNYFTDPMENVSNVEFEESLIKKGIFRLSFDFEEFYELDDLHYVCTLFYGDRYFWLRIFNTEWDEIQYLGLENDVVTEEDLVWSRFFHLLG